MNEFISNILSRHLNPVNNIIPRLPGIFEPVNFPSANTTDISAGIDNIREVSLPQETTGISKGHRSETNFNAVTAVNKFPGDKKVNQETSFEMRNKPETPVYSGIKPITVNQFNEKPLVNDLEQDEIPGSVFINNIADDTGIPADKYDSFNQHISILKQKIIKASSERKNIISEEKKTIQAGLIKPLMNDLNARTNLKTTPLLNEQPITSVIKVSIGRIEVRAVTTASPAKVNRTELQKPNLTLDEYLKRRNGTEK